MQVCIFWKMNNLPFLIDWVFNNLSEQYAPIQN